MIALMIFCEMGPWFFTVPIHIATQGNQARTMKEYLCFGDRGYEDVKTNNCSSFYEEGYGCGSADTSTNKIKNMFYHIFAHQGFCVYEALAHLGMIKCILTARRPVYNESFHCCND